MIQRIQTIYLLLAAIVTSLLFFYPIADLANSAGTSYVFRYRGLYEISGSKDLLIQLTIPLAIMLLINILLPLITIFLYKKRPLQMKLCILNIILLLVSLGLIAIYAAISFSKIEAEVIYRINAVMPAIALILTVMAYNRIRKDEKLVKSVDRIR